MLISAYYLYRRRLRALWLVVALLIALGLFNLFKGFDFEEAVGDLGVAALLWRGRASFHVEHEPLSRRSLLRSALAAAAVYWLVHSTVDWTWTFPALSLPALLLLGVAAVPERGRPLRPLAAVPIGVAAVALAVLAFAPPWLSDRYTNLAYAHPAQASSDLRRARFFDPLSTAPYEAQAALARGSADIPPLRTAVRKEPRQVDLRFELGLAYPRADRKTATVRELEAALRLDPRSDDVVRALRSARGR